MLSNHKVLVFGTTSDYIDLLIKYKKDKVIFLTEPSIRSSAKEPQPESYEEIISELNDTNTVLNAIENHLKKYDFTLSGIACFDCESLYLASIIAKKYNLLFSSPEGVENSRDKFKSKQLWENNTLLNTPKSAIILAEEDIHSFFSTIKGKVVLKPRTGSGSELTFLCNNTEKAVEKYHFIKNALKNKKDRLYTNPLSDTPIIIEEFIDSEEYSADFVINRDKITILRVTKKIRNNTQFFGTTIAYSLLDKLPESLSQKEITQTLYNSAKTLNIDNAICMADFFVKGNKIYLLEVTPRPGGDCIPFLLEKSNNLNILSKTIDFAENKNIDFTHFSNLKPALAVRIFSTKSGTLKHINLVELYNDNNYIDSFLYKRNGDIIIMPPESYSSWQLGYIIMKRDPDLSEDEQTKQVLNKIKVTIYD